MKAKDQKQGVSIAESDITHVWLDFSENYLTICRTVVVVNCGNDSVKNCLHATQGCKLAIELNLLKVLT